MKKIFIALVFFASFIAPATNAQSSSCTISVFPTTGYANQTKFSATGTIDISSSQQASRVAIVDESKNSIVRNLGFLTLTKTSFSVEEFGLANQGKYHLNLIISTTRAGQNSLCSSEAIEISPISSTPATCDPPGRNSNDLSKCADSNCYPVGPIQGATVTSSCEPFGVIAPTPTPTGFPPPCATLAPDGKCISVNTAIGNISTEPQKFVQGIFTIVLGIAGGIALVLIMISGYKMMASQGNPESLENARGQLISAVVGLLFIIFSFVILQVIGVDLLHIPGFQ